MADADFLALTLAGTPPLQRRGETPWLTWQWLDEGVMQLSPRRPAAESLVLSAGIHGNETAPVELLNDLVAALLAGSMPLAVRLLVILGNPGALRAGKRYLDYDMNRLFTGGAAGMPDNRESVRSRQLQYHMHQFYQAAKNKRRHLDLHTAIRGSRHVRFGLLPYRHGSYDPALLAWLNAAGLDALVRHIAPGSTFTHYSSGYLAAASVTLELGKALPFGENEMAQFSAIRAALVSLISGSPLTAQREHPMRRYRVSQQIIRTQADFMLLIPPDTLNFTGFGQDELLARETGREYRVQAAREWILFPNPSVALGLRAGLMLVADKDT